MLLEGTDWGEGETRNERKRNEADGCRSAGGGSGRRQSNLTRKKRKKSLAGIVALPLPSSRGRDATTFWAPAPCSVGGSL